MAAFDAPSKVAKVPKTKPKKTLKRLALAAVDEPPVRTIAPQDDNRLCSDVASYLATFKTKKEAKTQVVLGLNTITRAVESCSMRLKVVLVNANVRPQRLIIHLQELCVQKGYPVVAVRGMDKIAKALRTTIKGLKTSVTAIGLNSNYTPKLIETIMTLVPPVRLRKMPDIPSEEMATTTSIEAPPLCPKVDIQPLFIELRTSTPSTDEGAMSLETEPSAIISGARSDECDVGVERRPQYDAADLISLLANSVPLIDYDSFIGSDRPLVDSNKPQRVNPAASDALQQPSTSGYRPPVVKIR